MNDDEFIAEFRVRKRDLPTLTQPLRIPRSFQLSQRSVLDGIEGLFYAPETTCISLWIWRPHLPFWTSSFSMATNHVLDYIHNTYSHLITQWNHTMLSPRALEVYAETIHGKGTALENCFGFVDGTVRPIARPDEHQRIMYNGHKRVHALKSQSLALPNGLIGNLYGPVGKWKLCVSFDGIHPAGLPSSLYKFKL